MDKDILKKVLEEQGLSAEQINTILAKGSAPDAEAVARAAADKSAWATLSKAKAKAKEPEVEDDDFDYDLQEYDSEEVEDEDDNEDEDDLKENLGKSMGIAMESYLKGPNALIKSLQEQVDALSILAKGRSAVEIALTERIEKLEKSLGKPVGTLRGVTPENYATIPAPGDTQASHGGGITYRTLSQELVKAKVAAASAGNDSLSRSLSNAIHSINASTDAQTLAQTAAQFGIKA